MNNRISSLLDFLDSSPTAWHAVDYLKRELSKNGFQELKEQDKWEIEPGKAYYITKNGSSLAAFIAPQKSLTSLRLVASHTDSPTFKIKPNGEYKKEGMLMLSLEVYGAPLLSSWLNRDLGIAGRAVLLDSNDTREEVLITLKDCPILIPQLAIHLDRNVNDNGLILNKQEHLSALVSTKGELGFLQRQLEKLFPKKEVLSKDLFVFPLEKGCLIGEEQNLISSYRLDSLASVHACLHALLEEQEAHNHGLKMGIFWDNEEIGSTTAQGAASPFFTQILERISLAYSMTREDLFRLYAWSICASVDLAHAFHPNYAERHEPRHLAHLNRGIVIKSNAQHRYASDAKSISEITYLCKKNQIPFQYYVTRGDIPCGSTIGPIYSNLSGIATVDLGCPQLSMHSSRELMGTEDHLNMCRLLKTFLENQISL